MRVLVTGADGFVGRRLVARLVERGAEVLAGSLGGTAMAGAEALALDVRDGESCLRAAGWGPQAVVHLAALSSTRQATIDPVLAWEVNALGTVRLLEALVARAPGARLLLVSSCNVYGHRTDAVTSESAPLAPASPYAASKAAAELAGLETWRRRGLPVVIARPYPHTGRGQPAGFVLPDWVAAIRAARADGRDTVPTGGLDVVRETLHVDDVVEAYLALLAHGAPGEAYNVARGEGDRLADLFDRLAARLGGGVRPVPHATLVRRGEPGRLVGDPGKLARAAGWRPTRTIDDILDDLVTDPDAQAL